MSSYEIFETLPAQEPRAFEAEDQSVSAGALISRTDDERWHTMRRKARITLSDPFCHGKLKYYSPIRAAYQMKTDVADKHPPATGEQG